jgi:hypothetical protein
MTTFEIRPTDQAFTDSPGAGAPACTCSRCGQPIAEGVVPIRVWDTARSYREWRFHPACIGLSWPRANFDFGATPRPVAAAEPRPRRHTNPRRRYR